MKHFTFYNLYYNLIKNVPNDLAGQIANNLCKVMFEDKEITVTDDTEAFIWSNIEDILLKTKEIEQAGRTPKTFNKKMQHFCFEKSYFKAMKLLNEVDCGIYIKALCAYMFENKEPKKLKPPIDAYFELAKLKLQLSKVRINSGKKGGTAKRVPLTTAQIEANKHKGSWLTFEEFMRRHPDIKNDLYKNSQHLTNCIDWQTLELGMEQSSKYKNCASLYMLLSNYKELKDIAYTS